MTSHHVKTGYSHIHAAAHSQLRNVILTPTVTISGNMSWRAFEATRRPQWTRLNSDVSSIEAKFRRLVAEWREGVRMIPWAHRKALHPAYQRIIGMGPDALPLILRELERENDEWYWALSVISDENPVAPRDQGRRAQMRERWLAWGRRNGLLTERNVANRSA